MLIKKLSKVGLSLLMTASFSISAFAGYDFSEDGNTNNTEYNGTNDVYSNGIYVGTDPVTGLPIYKFEMDNIQNTYNGETNIHGNGDALFDGYDQYGTYNGTLDVVGTDVGPGTTTSISNANINAVTSISAADAVADNDLNAGVLIKDSTFTNDVTVQSSTVYLDENANVILGSSDQMSTLISSVQNISTVLNNAFNTYIIPYLRIIRQYTMIVADNIAQNRVTTDSNNRNITLSSDSTLGTVQYTLGAITYYTGYTFTNGAFTFTTDTRYGNFRNMVQTTINNFAMQFRAYINEYMNIYNIYTIPYLRELRKYMCIMMDNLAQNRSTTDANNRTITLSSDATLGTITYTLGALNSITSHTNTNGTYVWNTTVHYGNYRNMLNTHFNNIKYVLSTYVSDYSTYFIGYGEYRIYDFITQDQYYQFSSRTANCTFREAILNRMNVIISFLNYFCSRFFEWYYPLDGTAPYYWRTYNSDTDEMESVNLARLMYDISWYLGHISIGEDIKTEVQSLSDNLASYQQAEQNLQNRVTSSIQSFIPDVTLFGGFAAISWVSRYLQNIYVSLGTYGTVIMIGLLLGVCMQFIGYFRYKY